MPPAAKASSAGVLVCGPAKDHGYSRRVRGRQKMQYPVAALRFRIQPIGTLIFLVVGTHSNSVVSPR